MKKKYECNECGGEKPCKIKIGQDFGNGWMQIYLPCNGQAIWQEVKSKEEKSKESIVRKAIGASIEDLAKRIEAIEKLCVSENTYFRR